MIRIWFLHLNCFHHDRNDVSYPITHSEVVVTMHLVHTLFFWATHIDMQDLLLSPDRNHTVSARPTSQGNVDLQQNYNVCTKDKVQTKYPQFSLVTIMLNSCKNLRRSRSDA
jgi:hypothetical protein